MFLYVGDRVGGVLGRWRSPEVCEADYVDLLEDLNLKELNR